MSGQFDPQEVLARNPQTDPDRPAGAQDMLRRPRETGGRRTGHDLVPPFGGRRAAVQDDKGADSRPSQLKRSPHRT